MKVSKFVDLLSRGFDIEFNINDVFYSFTKSSQDGKTRFYIGNEKYTEHSSFGSIDDMLNYKIEGIILSNIIESKKEEEINY